MQDWPRNDQVLRMDWNVGPDTTFYGRLQFGYEKRAGGVSFLGSTGAGWPQQPSKYEIDTVSYVNTLLHTFNPTTFAEFTVGVNWSHQYTSALDQAAKDNNDRTMVLPGLPQYFPSANPDNLMPQASFNGGLHPERNHAVVQRRSAMAVLRLQRAVELLGQPDEDQGRPHDQDGPLRRAHDAPGAAVLAVQRQPELQYGRSGPAQHQHRLRQRIDRRGHAVFGI